MPVLLERERELDRLGARLDAARAGGGGLVVVEGAPGIGKTTILRAAVGDARRRGFEVTRARGAELERDWPFGIARQLFEPALRQCSADDRAELLDGAAGLAKHVVLPDLAAEAVPVDACFGTLHGLYWLCANLAARRPLLLVVDDAQWADEASLRFLGVLARRVDALAVLVLLAQRPAPPDALAELAGDPQTELVALRPLSAAATERLLAAWSPDVDTEFVRACVVATGGSPFLLSRLAQSLRDRGTAFTADHVGEVARAGVDAVRDAVGTALARLVPSVVVLAEAIAVLGDDVELSSAAQLARIEEGAADEAVEALVRAAILEDARPLRFVHAIVRDAIAARLPAGARASLHARAAELLTARRATPDAIAVHLLATEPRGRPWVVECLMTAARQALAQGTPATAAVRLERALAEPPATATVRTEVLLDLGRAKCLLARRDALEHLRAAYVLAPTAVLRARTALELAWMADAGCDIAAVVALLDRAINEVGTDRELALQLQAARLATLHTWAPMLVRSWADELRRWADLKGDTPAERLLLAQLGVAQLLLGGPADAAAQFAERAAGGPAFEPTAGGGMSLMFAPSILYKADRLDAAARVLEHELHTARRRGSLVVYAFACTFKGMIARRRGALATAEADLRAGLDALPPDAWRRLPLVAGLLDVLVQKGDQPGAQALLTAAGWDVELPDDRASTALLASRSGLRFAQRDVRRALADALEARRRSVRHGVADLNWDGWARIVVLYHRLGDPDAARREADAQLIAARRWDTPGAIGQALHASALIASDERRPGLLRDAVEQLERSPARLEYAHALVDYGAALRRRGDRAAARTPLRHGLDLAAAAGAHPLAEHARQELRASGVRIRRDAQNGIAALTASERRIVEHAASGATNPQIAQALFVTVKTVEMHLHNAYRKLDITSRHQLHQHLPAAIPQ
jgi:DNA-binding CsgD family transcriptional regulator